MFITVQLDEHTLRHLLAELLPVTILLDEDKGLDGRWVRIDPARHVELRAGEGIRVATSGALRWTLGQFPVTLGAQHLALMLRPVVRGAGAAGRLLFRPVIETARLEHVPSLLERGAVRLVNRALELRSERLGWDFGRRLALRFGLPDTLVPLEEAAVSTDVALLRVRADAIELTVALTMHISRPTGQVWTGAA